MAELPRVLNTAEVPLSIANQDASTGALKVRTHRDFAGQPIPSLAWILYPFIPAGSSNALCWRWRCRQDNADAPSADLRCPVIIRASMAVMRNV